MKSADLHPEDLIDKRVRGALTAEEGAILEQHLARCGVCRFELAARDELALEDAGEPTDEDVAAAIAGALGAVKSAPKPAASDAPEESAPAAMVPARRRWRVAGAMLVAAALMIGSAATARWSGAWTAIVTGLGVSEGTQRTVVEAATATAAAAAPATATATARATARRARRAAPVPRPHVRLT